MKNGLNVGDEVFQGNDGMRFVSESIVTKVEDRSDSLEDLFEPLSSRKNPDKAVEHSKNEYSGKLHRILD